MQLIVPALCLMLAGCAGVRRQVPGLNDWSHASFGLSTNVGIDECSHQIENIAGCNAESTGDTGPGTGAGNGTGGGLGKNKP